MCINYKAAAAAAAQLAVAVQSVKNYVYAPATHWITATRAAKTAHSNNSQRKA